MENKKINHLLHEIGIKHYAYSNDGTEIYFLNLTKEQIEALLYKCDNEFNDICMLCAKRKYYDEPLSYYLKFLEE